MSLKINNFDDIFLIVIHRYGVSFISVVVAAMYVSGSVGFFSLKVVTDFHSLNGGIHRDIPYHEHILIPLASVFNSDIVLLCKSE